MKLPTTKIFPNLQGTKQRKGVDNVEYDISVAFVGPKS